MIEFNIKKIDAGKRLDKFLRDRMKDYSRSYIQGLIEASKVSVNGDYKKSNYKLVKGDKILVFDYKEGPVELKKEDLKLDIIYEDKDILLVNKEAGILVHPTSQVNSSTLVNGLLYHTDSLSDRGEDYRPGIVHRLDKDTSGILIIAKNNLAYDSLVGQFKNRSIKRHYLAVVDRVMEEREGTINKPIGRDINNRTRMGIDYKNGREAISKYKVLDYTRKYSLVEVELITGRMHQIRVHLNSLGNPVVGDRVYNTGPGRDLVRYQLLHAYKLGFIHPRSLEYMEFKTKIPERFVDFLRLEK